jgi:beta-phosphoglucomutase
MQQPFQASQACALIWDMDGVLVDSGEYHFRAWREILHAQQRAELTLEQFRLTFGMRNPEMLRLTMGHELPAEEAAFLADTKEARYRELVQQQGLPLLPGVSGWLDAAREHGWKQAVASSAPRANVEAIMDGVGIRSYFNATIAAEDVAQGKPAPDVFLAAAHALGVPASCCIVVEDAPAGVAGARAAGMTCLGVLTTHEHLDADIVIASLQDLTLYDARQRLLGNCCDEKTRR